MSRAKQSNTTAAVRAGRKALQLPEWLNRDLVTLPYGYTLCTTREMFDREQARLGVKPEKWATQFGNGGNGARVAFFDDTDVHEPLLSKAAIVTIDPLGDRNPIQLAAMLVHEAVHIWQWGMADIGEKSPSDEFMAYGIQRISQALMYEFARQAGLKA